MNMFSLVNRVAIVTGSAGLLGKAHCRALAAAGANVVVADLIEKDCIEIANELGEKHLGIVLNVTEADSIKNAKEIILQKYGRIDILVNNAAINDMFENPLLGAKQSMFEHYPLDMFNKCLEVNVMGMFLCSQILGSVMAEQKSGSIINIASTYGIVAPDQSLYQNKNGEQVFYKSPAYPVTKSAVIGFTKYLAAYWGNKNVRVNSLSPGGVENNQDDFFQQKYAAKTLLGRMADADDYQGAIVFLASDASAYMTGANLVVDGGFTTI
jgi:NAD(P)-dependent dehydrogenase (short-subunit alcohol dehydrogenase family)